VKIDPYAEHSQLSRLTTTLLRGKKTSWSLFSASPAITSEKQQGIAFYPCN